MDLPDFDFLLDLAKNHPEELDALHRRCNRQFIDAAPDHMKRRLYGLLFQIDMEKRRSKNSTQCCINLSKLMMNSFVDLQTAITNLKVEKVVGGSLSDGILDNVIYFPAKNKSGSE